MQELVTYNPILLMSSLMECLFEHFNLFFFAAQTERPLMK